MTIKVKVERDDKKITKKVTIVEYCCPEMKDFYRRRYIAFFLGSGDTKFLIPKRPYHRSQINGSNAKVRDNHVLIGGVNFCPFCGEKIKAEIEWNRKPTFTEFLKNEC